MLLLLQIILCCLLYLALVKCAVRDSGRNCLYFYPDAYLDEAQKRGIADKTEELRKGKRFMTFFCLVIFAVLVAIIAGWNGVKDFHTACFEAYLFLVVMNWFDGLDIHEGRNRQVRKMVEQIGHQVVMLRRIRFGPLKLGELPRGMWRPLTQEELDALKKL